ncbi:MAG: hypothetical protein MUW56_06530 [Chryseobacterium sp.]|uniref:hypothetical protein n=1 Tax=Chryseobacterium sp. TaxID=1871047 RepID=UPI0025BFE9CF|nr:hypothetical protein [Chryseobacterium sp.]MCJ7933289.1 hypothetical protein [Chryseobacterium sp.]
MDGAKDNASTGAPTPVQQSNDFVVLNNGNVGMGTVTPTNKLDIRSTTNGALKIADGSQGANRVLTSDANGVATWKDLPANTDTSIYAGNGTLAGNRIVAQAGSTLAFTSSAATGTNHFSVDGSTFSVDAVTNRVGIGTTTPKNLLDLGSGSGKKLALWNSTAGDDFYGFGNAADVLQIFAGAAAAGDALMTLNKNGRVGIGTTAPTNVLDVRSATNGALKLVDGTQGANKVLTSDANGVATWKDLPANTDTSIYAGNGTLAGNRIVAQAGNTLAFTSTATAGTSHFTVDGTTFNVDARNNRIGLGTATPNNLLDLGTTQGKKLAVWNSTAGDDFYGFGAAQNVLQFFAGVPTTGSALMTLNKNGRVGIGTTAPTNVLDVRSATNGALKIVDGTQGVNKILTSDANGVATWQRAAANTATGTTSGGINIPFVADNTLKYTGTNISLPPGKWMVTISQLIRLNGTLTADQKMFVRSTLSEDNVGIGAVATQSPDVSSRPTLMSFIARGPNTGLTLSDVAVGVIYVNNSSGNTKTYRYVAGSTVVYGPAASTSQLEGFGGGWSENSIFATAVN